MTSYTEAARDLPIRDEVDVLIVGGGTAGVIAAIAAARLGASTLVLERYGFLGGLVVGGPTGMHTYFNCYHDAEGTPNVPAERKKQLMRGIPSELADRLIAEGGCPGHIELERAVRFISVITPVDPEVFKWVAQEMVLEAGASVSLYTWVSDVIMEGDAVRGVVVESKSGREAILAKVIVDTSGDADVAARAGAPHVFVEKFGVSMNLRMVGVDVDTFGEAMLEQGLAHQFARAVKLGGTRPGVLRVGASFKPWADAIQRYGAGIGGILSTSIRDGDLTHMNCTGIQVNGVDVADMTRASVHLHRQIHNIVAFLRAEMPGFQHGYLAATGPLLGVRRTRLIQAQFDMPREYVLGGQGAPDEIARFAFVDLPDYAVERAGSYGIPYRSLLPQKVENLLVAGRSLSTDHVVHNSTRNVGCCMLTGQAAGAAAALSALDGVAPSRLDAARLRDTLAAQGAYFE